MSLTFFLSKIQMKTKTGIIALITVTLVLSACSASSSTTAAEFEQTAAMIESGSYQFAVRSATPSGGKTIQITSLYTLVAKEGNYEAYLPYFGRAYSGAYGDGGSVEFNGEPENLEITRKDNKNNISVKFTIKSGADQYTVNLEVGGSGYGNLVISNPKQRPITYYGLASDLKD
jgi:hypothetical protein